MNMKDFSSENLFLEINDDTLVVNNSHTVYAIIVLVICWIEWPNTHTSQWPCMC